MVSELQRMKVPLVSFQQEGKNPGDDRIRNGQYGWVSPGFIKTAENRPMVQQPWLHCSGYHQNGTVPHKNLLKKR